MKRRVRKHIQKSTWNLTLIATICITVLLLCTATFAKYINWEQIGSLVEPQNFYFTSNYLTNDSTVKTYTVYADSVNITVMNTDGLNVTEGELLYQITDNSDSAAITNADGTKFTEGNKTLTPGNGLHTYTLSGERGETVTVTAISSRAYKKVISANFVFRDPGDSSYYRIEDCGYYNILHIFTGADMDEKTITVAYDKEKFAPDNTDDRMRNWMNGIGGEISVDANSHYTLLFFENTVGNYTKEDTLISNNRILVP